MNNKLLSISYIALTLCTFSTPSAADVTFLGVSANNLMSSANIKMTITSKPDEITMLNISNTGVKGQTGEGSNTPDTRNCVKSMFAKNPPRTIVGGLITHNSPLANMAGSIVGKRGISLNSERFSFHPSTVFGTNGRLTLNFTNPLSLIKSFTMELSDITVTHGGEKLHIGSVWGDFTGPPSSDEQIIHLIGYTSIVVEFNPAAIAELLSKK